MYIVKREKTLCSLYSEISCVFQALADNDAVRLLTLNCGHKPYINAIHSKVS